MLATYHFLFGFGGSEPAAPGNFGGSLSLPPYYLFDGFSGTAVVPVVTDTVKTGTGGIDRGDGLRRITKPTGFGYPKKKTLKLKKDLPDVIISLPEVLPEVPQVEYTPIAKMSMVEIDKEIGMLLRERMDQDDDEMRKLFIIAAVML